MADLAWSCEVGRPDFDRADEKIARLGSERIAGGLVTSPAKVVDAGRSQSLSIREPDRRRNFPSATEKTFRRVTI